MKTVLNDRKTYQEPNIRENSKTIECKIQTNNFTLLTFLLTDYALEHIAD